MITLIPNSGVQFITKEVNLSDDKLNKFRPFEYYEEKDEEEEDEDVFLFKLPYYLSRISSYIEKAPSESGNTVINAEAINVETWEIMDEEKILDRVIHRIPEEEIISIPARKALECFENKWLPVPYLLKTAAGDKFHDGPTAWARMWFTKIGTLDHGKTGATHHVVFAFDTTEAERQHRFMSLKAQNARTNQFFAVPRAESDLYQYWYGNEWIDNWLRQIVPLSGSEQERVFTHVGYYFQLLKVLLGSNVFEEIEIPGQKGTQDIDVDLVLDVGNSRTCGVIFETDHETPFQFTNAVPVAIRDLGQPNRLYREPFEMRVAFHEQVFGNRIARMEAGDQNIFNWPSLVRVGKEALRYSVIFGQKSNSYMSSPKRYLWDSRKRPVSWMVVPANKEVDSASALFGVAHHLTADGVLLERAREDLEKKGEGLLPIAAMEANYSKSSLMTFAMFEILLQTLSYINSHEFRGNSRLKPMYKDFARKLKRVVFTCPTAMLEEEKKILREHAEDAVRLLKDYFPSSLVDEVEIIPSAKDIGVDKTKRKNWGYDEATCNQLAFVYGEIMHRFRGDAGLFFKYSQVWQDYLKEKNAVRIASIDIGGGTTDVMVCEYSRDPDAHIVVLSPDPLFWEGFNLAGDDIVKSIVERVVLPPIAEYAREQGCTSTFECMNFLFGPHLGTQNGTMQQLQLMFSTQVAYPIALGILDHARENRNACFYTFNDFYTNNKYANPVNQVIQYVNDEFRNHGATSFNLLNVKWNIDNRFINQVIGQVIEKLLGDVCKKLKAYECDYVLLSGCPTTLPVVKDLFYKYLPVPPERIIPMGNYRIGEWYPFSNNAGQIKDPKTCVAVGAAIALMSGELMRLDNFRLDIGKLKEKFESTAKYIGIYGKIKSHLASICFDENENNKQLRFDGPMLLGFKQFEATEWVASPMYLLDFASSEKAQMIKDKLPLSVNIERSERNRESLKIRGTIYDRDGHAVSPEYLILRLQTLADEQGYWLDSGIFSINDNVDGL